MRLPMATPKTKPFSCFTHIGWKLPAGFSWLCFPLECCEWCCFWSGFYLYIYVCSLCPVPGPWALLGLSDQEGAWETAHSLRSRLLLWSWQRHFLPHPICLRSLINYRCFQGALAWGRKRKWSLPIEWSLGRMVKGRLGYTTEKNAVKSGCQEVLIGRYFGFWFWNCCAKSATDSLGRCLLMPGDHKPNHGALKPPPWDCFKEK